MRSITSPIALVWVLVLSIALGTAAWSISAAARAHAAAAGRRAALDAITAQSAQLAALTASIPAWSTRPRPQSGLASKVTAALEAAGLSASALSTLTGDNESPAPPTREPRVVKRRIAFTLSGVTLPALGRFLDAWRLAQPDWTVTAIDLAPTANSPSGSSRPPTPSHSTARAQDRDTGADLPLAATIAVEYLFLDPPHRHHHQLPRSHAVTRAPFLLYTGARALTFGLALGALTALGACAGTNSAGPYAPASEESRNTIEAQRLTQQAAAVMDSDPKQAEALLRQALAADLYHGPAHNNLGVIYLEQGSLYPAASEFEWARKLMPGHPDPRMNLAFTLEQAGRVDEAIATYKTALEVYPDHLPTIQALARLQVRAARTDDHTKVLLHDIAFRGDSQEWRDWAKREVVLKGY